MLKKACMFVAVMMWVVGVGCAWGSVSLNAFPDPELRRIMSSYDSGWIVYDSDGYAHRIGDNDGILSDIELVQVTSLSLGSNVKSIKGTELLTTLTYLSWYCSDLNLTALDVSNNPKLTVLTGYHNDNLKSLNVSGCTALETLEFTFGHLEKLNVSGCTDLKTLNCFNNSIAELDLSGCTALEFLHCAANQMTQFDLSQNKALSFSDTNSNLWQKVSGLKLKKTSESHYEINMKDYVPHLENIMYIDNPQLLSYNEGTGIAVFNGSIESLNYGYNTHLTNSDGDIIMPVRLTNAMNINAIEREGSNIYGIINDITENGYINYSDTQLTESDISELNYSDYGKSGLAADGNSRLILRVKTDKPGTVSFSGYDEVGAKLESFSHNELSPSDKLNTTQFSDWLFETHQVSAVLVAPERFPEDKNFPSDTFKVHVKFTDEDGEITEDDLELKLEAAPVILIPGMFNPGGFTNVFAVASVLASAVNPGDSQHTFGLIQQELLSRGFKKEHIAFWNHGGRKGIKNLVGHDDNHLFTILANMFESYAQEGIVCTKADVIAHGMGGLIVREFLNEANKSNAKDANNWSARSYKQGMIHRVINIAVPHMGTPLANVLLGDFSLLNNVAMGNDALAQTCLWLLHNKYLKIYSEPFLKEIAVGSDFLNNLPLPANVPMHFVYGDVKGYLDSFENIKDSAFMLFNLAKFVKSAGKNIAKYQKLSEYSDFVQFSNTLQNVNPKTDLELLKTINNLDDKILLKVASQQEAIIRDMMTNNEIRSVALSFAEMASQNPQVTGFFQILGAVSDGLEALNPVTLAFNLYFSMQRVIFSGQAHDMFVPVASAIAGLQEYSTGFPEPGTNSWMDWRFRYSTLCQQGDVAYAVATILRRNDMNDFAILKKSVQLTGALPQQVKANSTVYGELNLEGIDLENLCATNFTLTANQSAIMIPEMGTSVVKFTASAKNLVSNDVQLVIQKDGLDRTFPMYTDDGKSFEINIEFTSSDSGAMFAYCYTPNEKKLYVSNTLQFSCIRNLDNVDITEISFFGKDTLYTNVNLDIPAGLYAVASDGKYYDVSSLLAGTQWTSTEIARVNDNGCIHGLKEGNTTLTATFRGLTASVNVEVSAAIEEYTQPEETAPQILSEILSDGITGQPYVSQLKASGTAPITWTHTGRLPAGLTLSESGLISGTPIKAGKFSFTIKATNAFGSDTARFTLQVFDPVQIITASLKDGTIGKNYSVTLKAKGTRPITWNAEGLPDGLAINAKTGRISGKPSVYGIFSVKITGANGAGSLTEEFMLTVKGIPPKIAGNFARPELNEHYSSGLRLTAGSLPVVWSIEGTLPEGLTFDTGTGIISGIPSEFGRFRLMITASNDGGITRPRTVTLNVKGTPPRITTTKLPDAQAGQQYSLTLTATGSTPITWTAENLPGNLYLDGDMIKGIPSESGRPRITVYATNPVKTVKKILTLKINPAVSSLPDTAKNEYEHENVLGHVQSIATPHRHESMTGNGALSLKNDYVIVAVLPVISCDESGMYDFSVALSDYATVGAELVYIANSDVPSDDDGIAEFYDSDGAEISHVPESRKIIVSVWLNAGTIYRPSIAVRK